MSGRRSRQRPSVIGKKLLKAAVKSVRVETKADLKLKLVTCQELYAWADKTAKSIWFALKPWATTAIAGTNFASLLTRNLNEEKDYENKYCIQIPSSWPLTVSI
jgi:hypothetical protein